MTKETSRFDLIGREAGCLRLSKAFYSRVDHDAVLRPLFPGKSLRCATEELAAFLVQFFGGDESHTQYRWRLSLRESHARFPLSERLRSAWLAQMNAALVEVVRNEDCRTALADFFSKASLYLLGQDSPAPDHPELAALWRRQLTLDELTQKLSLGEDAVAILLAEEFSTCGSVYVGILAIMMDTGREGLVDYVTASIERDPRLLRHSYNGRKLLHFAAGSGSLRVVLKLLQLGADPDAEDAGGHTALYRAAGNRTPAAAEIVSLLVTAGASVNHAGGVTRSTALHQAARYGNGDVVRALLQLGASTAVRDKRGSSPLDRAINCRRSEATRLLRQHAG